jgi:hypothetical protein
MLQWSWLRVRGQRPWSRNVINSERVRGIRHISQYGAAPSPARQSGGANWQIPQKPRRVLANAFVSPSPPTHSSIAPPPTGRTGSSEESPAAAQRSAEAARPSRGGRRVGARDTGRAARAKKARASRGKQLATQRRARRGFRNLFSQPIGGFAGRARLPRCTRLQWAAFVRSSLIARPARNRRLVVAEDCYRCDIRPLDPTI